MYLIWAMSVLLELVICSFNMQLPFAAAMTGSLKQREGYNYWCFENCEGENSLSLSTNDLVLTFHWHWVAPYTCHNVSGVAGYET